MTYGILKTSRHPLRYLLKPSLNTNLRGDTQKLKTKNRSTNCRHTYSSRVVKCSNFLQAELVQTTSQVFSWGRLDTLSGTKDSIPLWFTNIFFFFIVKYTKVPTWRHRWSISTSYRSSVSESFYSIHNHLKPFEIVPMSGYSIFWNETSKQCFIGYRIVMISHHTSWYPGPFSQWRVYGLYNPGSTRLMEYHYRSLLGSSICWYWNGGSSY